MPKSKKKRHRKQDKTRNKSSEQISDCEDSSMEEEEKPVPMRLVAFAIFFAIIFVLVAGYF